MSQGRQHMYHNGIKTNIVIFLSFFVLAIWTKIGGNIECFNEYKMDIGSIPTLLNELNNSVLCEPLLKV